MSIQDLEKRMNQSLDRIRNRGELTLDLPQPYRLQAQLVQITQKFKMLEDNKPSSDKILLAIEKLEQTGTGQLSRRDWKEIAWGLCLKLDNRPQKLLFSNYGRQVIEHFQQAEEISTSIYLALLFSYFTLEQSEIDANSNNWIALRNTLKITFPALLKKVKHPSEWMQILNQYPELLEANPTRRISKELLRSTDENSITEITDKLRIPTNGWFWNSLINEVVQAIFLMNDQTFIENIGRLLDLSSKHQIYKNLILSNTLDRYAQTKICDQIHDALKTVSLDTWGNPQSESTSGWTNVKTETKKMVIRWFIRADLEAFFNLFTSNADQNRFRYWLRFIKQISSSYLILSSNSLQSKRPDHADFIKKNKGRLSQLSGSTANNNSFIIQIGNIFIVEFSEIGNATYFYRQDPIPKKHFNIAIFDLKYGNEKLSHTPNWQNRFDEYLSKLGIFPDIHNRSSPFQKH